MMNLRMPAEWEPHEGTWISWPWNLDTFPDGKLKNVEEIYLQMIEALTSGEKVFLLVNDEKTEEMVRKRLKKGTNERNLFIYQIHTEDVWFRDYGPIFVVRNQNGKREIAMTHWIFNAWGNKWPPLDHDTVIPSKIEKIIEVPRFEPGIVLEGGSIDVNGKGTLMTTEQCLLNKNRNPTLTKGQIEKKLSEFLGITHFIWLGEGIIGDDTDGHIDDIARFVNEDTVVYTIEKNRENETRLKNSTDQNGKKLNLIEMLMPGKIPGAWTQAPASYCNFYIGNSVVLVPIYHHPNDKIALRILEDAFPKRKVIGIYCEDLVYGFGSIHCVTQQQPLA